MNVQKESADQVSVEVKSAHPGRGISILALFLAVVALAGYGWQFWQSQLNEQLSSANLQISLSEISARLDELEATTGNLQQERSELVSEDRLNIVLNGALNSISDHQAELDSILRELRNANAGRRDAVLLEDAEQLLGMAARAASINKDAKSAELALLQADAILAELSDARLAPVRAALGEDLQSLRAASLPDVELIASRLSGLIQAVPGLPAMNGFQDTHPTILAEQPLEPAEPQNWRSILTDILNDLKSLVRIQRVDQSTVPLLAPEQRYFLELNLQLILQRANLAVWQRAPNQVRRDLDEAKGWVTNYFDANDAQVQSFLEALQDLRNEQLDAELPDLTRAYSALKAFRSRDPSQ